MKNTAQKLRNDFSERIQGEFRRVGLPIESPTEIARAINKELPKLSVTPQAVRKWLFGEGFPSQDKLVQISDWLGVSAQWLRYGSGERSKNQTEIRIDHYLGDKNSDSWMTLFGYQYVRLMPVVDKLSRLSTKDLRVVEGLVEILLNEQNQLNS